MRIIAGEFRGRKLLPPAGDVTRPVTDRVKQSLFDILTPVIDGAHIYDCFAGTGSMGLESLSRGAAHATFFEADRPAVDRLKKNIAALGVADRATIVAGDLFRWFDAAAPQNADVVFLDPPYRFLRERPDDVRRLAAAISAHHLAPGGTVVFRHDARDALDLPPLAPGDRRVRRHGARVPPGGGGIAPAAVTFESHARRPAPTRPPRSDRDDALAVVRRLREAGHVAYFAGGCVRDQLMGREPKDYDVATDAPPNRVRELFTKTDAVGAAFGVILVRQRRSMIEVATFRTDGSYADGRRPTEVTFSTAEEDAKRRDFTINGLFFDPVENKVIDYVGGQQDLKNNVLRAIGRPDDRFAEDHLRLLRAIRFAARFNFAIEPATDEAIARHAPHLARISPERIAEELRLMLTPPTRVRAWVLLQRYALDAVVFRFLQRPSHPAHPEIAGGRATVFERVAPGQPITFGLALAAATVEVTLVRLRELSDWPNLSVRQVVKALRQALRVSNEVSDELEGTLYALEFLLKSTVPTVAALKRFLARPTAPLTRTLLAALPEELTPGRGELERQLSDLEKTDYTPAPFITGDDLTAAGLKPGPVFKRVLDEVFDAQLEARVETKEAALEMALDLAMSK